MPASNATTSPVTTGETTAGTPAPSGAPPRFQLKEPLGRQALLACLIVILGAIEGWWKRTDFTTDAISYLDIGRAIPLKDWKMVFNPQWNVGYPLLLAAAKPFFPATPAGEWISIHVANMLVFIATWFAFLYLLRSFNPAILEHAESQGEALRRRDFLLFAGACLFIAMELCIDAVSRVGPDLLITMFFLLATATLWRLIRRPSYGRAAVLGTILAAGYWTKGIFLPLSLALLCVTAAALYSKRRVIAPAIVAFVVFAVVAAPYVAAVSWSFGHFTLGESGSLNYAFHVNYLPRWTNWQGGPAGYGMPIHPTHEVMKNPDLYVFAEPYHNTYPPFGNVVYWYQGYRHFFSAKYQAIAIARNLFYLAQILVHEPIFYAVILSAGLLLFAAENRKVWLKAMLRLWPFYLAALAGIALYVQVHLEDRYLSSFFVILCLVPFVLTVMLREMPPRRTQRLVMAVMALGAALNFVLVDREVLSHIRQHYTYAQNPEWRLGLALARAGIKPGSEMAAVGGPNASSTWAYIVHLRVGAELGGDPYDPHGPLPGVPDTVQLFWHSSPALQQKVLEQFRQAGAVAAIASDKPADLAAPPGWEHLDGTGTWLYRLQ